MFVQACLHLELFLLDPAIFLGKPLVDEFNGEDGVLLFERHCSLDTVCDVSQCQPDL